MLVLQSLESKVAGRVVVEVARSEAENHISLITSLDPSTSVSFPEVLSVSSLDQV